MYAFCALQCDSLSFFFNLIGLICSDWCMKETYGNGSSDSSDEDYDDGPLPKVRKLRNAKGAMAAPSSTPADIKYQSGKQKGSGHASDSGISEKLKVGGTGTSESPSSGKRKTYGEVSTKVFVGFTLVPTAYII